MPNEGKDEEMKIGDHVGYSAKFLRSVGALTGELPFLRGVITEITDYSSMSVASVDWGNETGRVNVKNLAKVGTAAMNAN
jgi:hypothetical protein